MGLQRLEGGDWLELRHPQVEAQRAEKNRLMRTESADLFALETGVDDRAVEDAVAELGQEITAEFKRQEVPVPSPDPTSHAVHPLDKAARLVREDLCLHLEREGHPILVAGSVCFPTRWTLAEKIGRPLDLVHGPVPGYADELALKVRQFMTRIRPGPGVWRRNWSIMPTDRLSLPGHHNEYLPTALAPGELYYRTERQTLRRLPATEAAVFTIAIDITPFPQLDPDFAKELADEIDGLPADFLAYKGLDHRPDVVPYLRSLSAER